MAARVSIRKQGDCYVGAIEIPLEGSSSVAAAALGDTRANALAAASLIAERITSDPIMRSLIPGRALKAIATVKGLAAAAKRGPAVLKSYMRSLPDEGRRNIARALHTEAERIERENDDAEQADEDGEVGFLPLAVIAAKYGPAAARKAKALYDARKKRKAAAKRKREAEGSTDETPSEQPEPDAQAEDDNGGES